MKIVSRAEAKAAGLKRYFTGEPCKHGHVEARITINGTCVQCAADKIARKKAADPTYNSRASKAYKAKNGYVKKGYVPPSLTESLQKRKQKQLDWQNGWRSANKGAAREKDREYAKKHPEKAAAKTALRRARKKQQNCNCCTRADFVGIYEWARFLDCEVDHKIPLAAGGVHCRHNLQILSREEHQRKTRADRKFIAEYKRALSKA